MAAFFQRIKSAYKALIGTGGTTPVQRAWLTGHTPGHWLSDHREELNHMTSWNYVGVHTIAKEWMQSEVTVYDRSRQQVTKGYDDSQDDVPDKKHPIAKLLRRPNPLVSGQEFLYQVGCQYRLTGGVVIWDVRNQIGKTVELWVLPRGWLTFQMPTEASPFGTWRVVPSRGSMGLWNGGMPFASNTIIDVRDTIMSGYRHPLYPGEFLSPLAACSQIIDIMEKGDKAALAALVNAVVPGLLFSVDPSVPADVMDQMYAQLEKKAGAENFFKNLIMQGVTKENLSTQFSELDSVNARLQNKQFALGIQGVPEMATGASDQVTYAGGAAVMNTHVELCVQPDLDQFAGALSYRFAREYGDDFRVEINAKRSDDPTINLQSFDKLLSMLDKKSSTPNEVRKFFNKVQSLVKLEPLPDGDVVQQPPMDMNALGASGQPGDMPTDDGTTPMPDTDYDLADDDSTGIPMPALQDASGNRMRRFSMNGKH